MQPFYQRGDSVLYHGDCLEVLKTLPDCLADAIVTDPPAGIGFMGIEIAKRRLEAERAGLFGAVA